MRYNSYRQYVTLNGVKRENKNDVLKNLKSYNKNIMRYIPKEEYNKFVSGHELVTYRFRVQNDNKITLIELTVWDTVSGTMTLTAVKNIPITGVLYFNGLTDGSRSAPNLINIQYFNESGQLLTVSQAGIQTTSHTTTKTVNASDVTTVSSFPDVILQTTAASDVYLYNIQIPKIMSYMVVEFNVTGMAYDSIPSVPITFFE